MSRTSRAQRAIASIVTVLQSTDYNPFEKPPDRLAALIYDRAGRDIYEGWKQDMGEANRW